jgi:hypothetical protein
MNNIVQMTTRTAPWLIGKDREGHWVVRDQSGMHGGIFINRAEALRFAFFENGRHPQAAVMVPGVLELDMRQPNVRTNLLNRSERAVA